MSALELSIEAGDVTEVAADALVLKHAQSFYGADEAVATRLVKAGLRYEALECHPGEHRLVETRGGVPAKVALFLGTVPLSSFGYHEIRLFAGRALQALSERSDVKTLACTVHGTNVGLDEGEAVLALVGGFIDAFQAGRGPKSLERVVVVERNQARVKRLRFAVEAGLGGASGVTQLQGTWGFRVGRTDGFVQATPVHSAGAHSEEKPHAFVAMPFAPKFDDIYHYGIQEPVNAAGLLCERVDHAVFDGLIVQRVRDRIESAKLVIADLTEANANVYLEVGYAWGRGRPTILLVSDLKHLRFDVAGYRCLEYRDSIRTLEQLLMRELEKMG